MKIIKGEIYTDFRGVVRFVNGFTLDKVVRMYTVQPRNNFIRAWQGHRRETKWFFAAKGDFLVKCVEMNTGKKEEYWLTDKKSEVLEIPGGFYNGFVSNGEDSTLLVFYNFTLEESKSDDFRKTIEELPW
ncbi:hypothetical protein [Schleiferia thermophila]